MGIAANATAQPVYGGFAVTSAQAKLIYISSHRLYSQNRLPKSIYLGFLNFKMLADVIFLLTLFHVVIKLCYESRVALISEYRMELCSYDGDGKSKESYRKSYT